jgi:hypothetical protein
LHQYRSLHPARFAVKYLNKAIKLSKAIVFHAQDSRRKQEVYNAMYNRLAAILQLHAMPLKSL